VATVAAVASMAAVAKLADEIEEAGGGAPKMFEDCGQHVGDVVYKETRTLPAQHTCTYKWRMQRLGVAPSTRDLDAARAGVLPKTPQAEFCLAPEVRQRGAYSIGTCACGIAHGRAPKPHH